MKHPVPALCALFIGMTVFCTAHACSVFSLRSGTHYTALSFDWDLEDGYILINPRNVKKTAFKVNNPVSWTSKYGSSTFNQYGREFPQGGMNEAGLVIGALWLDETQFVDPSDTLYSINNMQLVQFLLDNVAEVADVAPIFNRLQIIPVSPIKVHYYVADRTGAAMIIEITGKQLHCYPLLENASKCMTNSTFEDSKRFLEADALPPSPADYSSRARLQRLSYQLKNFTNAKRCSISDIFRILQSVKQPGRTQWNIVYDQNSCSIHIKTRSNPKIRTLNLKSIDFSCFAPIKGAPIVSSRSGKGVLFFDLFSISDNTKLMTTSILQTVRFRNFDTRLINEVGIYLESLSCQKNDYSDSI